MNTTTIIKDILNAGIESVLPDKLIQRIMKIDGETLVIEDQRFPLSPSGKLYVIGAGKASALMAQQVESILDERIDAGQIIVKYGHNCPLTRIETTEAGHPTPDENSFAGTQKLVGLMSSLTENDLVICLLSGGGSALFTDCPAGMLKEDIVKTNQLLVTCGADINEINAVRKHLSRIKGGWLARLTWPATAVSLILSDVIGDRLDVIASGPTSPDESTFADAYRTLEKYNLLSETPAAILNHIRQGMAGDVEETPKAGDPVFGRLHNIIIGSNNIALSYAKDQAVKSGFQTEIITSTLDMDSCDAAKWIVEQALARRKALAPGEKACLLFGGETTTKVTGSGKGGRNQHLALCAAKLLSGHQGITLLSAGSDGNDGPTDAAGAVVNSATWGQAQAGGLDGDRYLADFDSYHFFQQAGGLVITGATFTNVMDIIIVVIE
ncbi:glycerate kinase [Affinibrenneria salicis]|uniref:Glycerate kinase n=1 Tax=Affinibrenneria salicis TaxID=2590031 RepID=A0A5J5G533_9GAMM|nr:glycerate kinase [Affinibrenneria salicis]KAA9001985.1 glycerate kinase [Affinibrenneria salicis]